MSTSDAKRPPLDDVRVNANEPAKSMTEMVAVALTVPVLTVTVVVPGAMAVTMPSVFPTVATAGSADIHSNETFAPRPVESTARATRRSTPPTMTDTALGDIEADTGGSGGRTETVAVAESAPARAVTTVLPGDTPTT